jgi:acid phosphatase (class A)
LTLRRRRAKIAAKHGGRADMGWKTGIGVAAAIATFPAMMMVQRAGAQQASENGFLDAAYFDLVDVLPPAPTKEEPRGVADREIFKLTRQLEGTPRWTMAVGDVASDPAALLRDFSCAADMNFTPQNAPKTTALLQRASVDTARETNELKAYYRRVRPFTIDKGNICEPATPELAKSFDYPSGHATRAWTWGLILAELIDDRAAPILARARAYGESRVVCGSHNASAIEAGRLSASATLDVVRTEQAFGDAMAAARVEMKTLRKTVAKPSAQACSDEALLVSQPVMR